jgi:hypothetical protein
MHQDRLQPSPSVRASVSSDGLVLLDVEGGLVLSANQIGARIWELIEHHRTTDEISRQIAADYDVPSERARCDTETFVAALLARGLVIQDPQPWQGW